MHGTKNSKLLKKNMLKIKKNGNQLILKKLDNLLMKKPPKNKKKLNQLKNLLKKPNQ
jgi:hypothetical protein